DLPQAKIPAFPGAVGGGAYTAGGRGGRVMVVTSLADSGPGTLREACEAGGARIVVFNVAGIIELERLIIIRAPDIAIASHTDPGYGSCLSGVSFLKAAYDVVVCFVRFLRGATDLMWQDFDLGVYAIGNIRINLVSQSLEHDDIITILKQVYDIEA